MIEPVKCFPYSDAMVVPSERVVELLIRLMDRLGAHLGTVAVAHDLTAMQTKVLWQLDRPCPMRAIADVLHCDASNVTGIVDRLEARGLVERQSAPHDRRIKQVARTAAGDSLAELVRRQAFADVPPLNRLDGADLVQFAELLERLVPDTEPAAITR
jgi:DNA-binding MarR family transcriptional regulator